MTRRDWALASGIVAIAALLRLIDLGEPPRLVSDEFWYVRDACFYWRGSANACGMANLAASDRDVPTMLSVYRELTPEHPPLAKWLIGAPIELFGLGPRAWRLASVVAGALTVGVLYVLVRRTLHSTIAAAGGSVLLAVDYMHFVQSRLAMLDVFLMLFGVAAFLFCALDREQLLRRAAGVPAHRRWRLAAGIAAGAAAACKLPGAAVVIGVLLLTVLWEIGAASEHRLDPRRRSSEVVRTLVLLGVVPLVVYLATYAGRLDGSLLVAPWAEESWLRAWADRQWYMLTLHADKPRTTTAVWTLPMTERPHSYVLESQERSVRETVLFGNPILWWGGFGAVGYAAVRWCRGRGSAAAQIVVLGFLATYVGWLSVTLSQRPLHLWYAVPVAPFLYLALAYAYARVPEASRAGRALAATVVAVAIAAFGFFFPILSARELSHDDWRPRSCAAQALWLAPTAGCGSRAQEREAATR